MKFSLGGSLGKSFKGFSGKFNKSESFWGKWGRGLTTSLGQFRDDLSKAGGGTIGEQLLHRPLREGELQTDWNKGLKNMHRSTMGWSRQLSPLWDGGLTKPGGTFKDVFGNEEEGGMLAMWSARAGHHLFGRDIYADDDGGGSGGSGATVSDSEDPSLINQGNWQRPGQIGKIDRRNLAEIKAGGYHDRAKTQRGRLNVKDIS